MGLRGFTGMLRHLTVIQGRSKLRLHSLNWVYSKPAVGTGSTTSMEAGRYHLPTAKGRPVLTTENPLLRLRRLTDKGEV
jgi:hypothetical protein